MILLYWHFGTMGRNKYFGGFGFINWPIAGLGGWFSWMYCIAELEKYAADISSELIM